MKSRRQAFKLISNAMFGFSFFSPKSPCCYPEAHLGNALHCCPAWQRSPPKATSPQPLASPAALPSSAQGRRGKDREHLLCPGKDRQRQGAPAPARSPAPDLQAGQGLLAVGRGRRPWRGGPGVEALARGPVLDEKVQKKRVRYWDPG